MSETPLYYIEIFNNETKSKGYVVSSGDSFAIAEYPIPAMLFFNTPENAWCYVRDNKIETAHYAVSVKEQGDLISEGAITVVSVRGWYIANDDGWKLCYNHLTGLYLFGNQEGGYLLWLDKAVADKALARYEKHFKPMKLKLCEFVPQQISSH